jgi:transitional endoplasmic reticulum ATPase
VLAETLEREGEPAEALDHYAVLLDAGHLPAELLVAVGLLAVGQDRLDFAGECLEAAEGGDVQGAEELRRQLRGASAEDELERVSLTADGETGRWVPLEPEQTITFAEVGGLADVKKAIHRTIILPYQRPDLYAKYGRRAGGGILLYGAPGVGKTMLARATAGECGLPFLNVRIEEILDPYFGISERNLHAAFDQARETGPCVLFLDEIDAIAYTRRKQGGSIGRALVDQLLQELDSIGAENEDLLVLAATNAPWDVDEGLKRPGRFDRLVFVPPPDEPARERILEIHLARRHAAQVDRERIAKATPLYSGADLRSVVERAVDLVIDEAIDAGGDPPLTTRHLERAVAQVQPTTLEWLQTARNYVEFANAGGRYDDVASYLRTPEAKARRR